VSLEDKRDLLIADIEKAQTGAIVSVGSTSAATAGGDSTDVSSSAADHASLDTQQRCKESTFSRVRVESEFCWAGVLRMHYSFYFDI